MSGADVKNAIFILPVKKRDRYAIVVGPLLRHDPGHDETKDARWAAVLSGYEQWFRLEPAFQ